MTKRQITAAIERIRARAAEKNKGDGTPITEKWKATPPFVALENRDSTQRGHVGKWHCLDCCEHKPLRGGHVKACPKALGRAFMGGT